MRLNEIEAFEDRKSIDGKDGKELDSRRWEENPEQKKVKKPKQSNTQTLKICPIWKQNLKWDQNYILLYIVKLYIFQSSEVEEIRILV